MSCAPIVLSQFAPPNTIMVFGASRLISWATAIEAAFCWNVVVNPTIGAPLATSFSAHSSTNACAWVRANRRPSRKPSMNETGSTGPISEVRILIIDDLPQVFFGIVREVSRQQMREDPVCSQRLIAWETHRNHRIQLHTDPLGEIEGEMRHTGMESSGRKRRFQDPQCDRRHGQLRKRHGDESYIQRPQLIRYRVICEARIIGM